MQLTTDGEITVAFGPWHIHCTPFSDVEDTYNKAEAQAMKMIDEINTEKVVLVHESGPFASTIQVYSWLGT